MQNITTAKGDKMKLLRVLLFLFFSFSIANAAKLSSFYGTWTGNGGIVKVVIKPNGLSPKVSIYGKCHPTACRWGEVRSRAYGYSVSSNLRYNTSVLVALYNPQFARKIVTIKKSGLNKIKVEVFTRFTDGSGRNSFVKSYILKRNLLREPLRVILPISPRNHSVFNHYPRTTTLRWRGVSNVEYYIVQIDCFHCCQTNRWCYDVNRRGLKQVRVYNTKYTFNFVGAQSGRWRVWGILRNGRKTSKTAWQYFKYTR